MVIVIKFKTETITNSISKTKYIYTNSFSNPALIHTHIYIYYIEYTC